MANGEELLAAIQEQNELLRNIRDALKVGTAPTTAPGGRGAPVGGTVGRASAAQGQPGAAATAAAVSGAVPFGPAGILAAAGQVGAVLSSQLVQTGLNVATDLTNPFRTDTLKALDAADTIAGLVPGGRQAARIAFDLSGLSLTKAAEESALSEGAGLVRGLVRRGVIPTEPELQQLARAIRPVAQAEVTAVKDFTTALGDLGQDAQTQALESALKTTEVAVLSFGAILEKSANDIEVFTGVLQSAIRILGGG